MDYSLEAILATVPPQVLIENAVEGGERLMFLSGVLVQGLGQRYLPDVR